MEALKLFFSLLNCGLFVLVCWFADENGVHICGDVLSSQIVLKIGKNIVFTLGS